MKKGIDVSKWQGVIDFARVKKSGVEFAILRSSYRQTLDTRFKEYVADCKVNNIPIVGVYHFMYALTEQAALDEAKFCVREVKAAGLGTDTYIFCDFEYDSVKKAAEVGVTLGKAECNTFTRIFCEYVESQGFKAGIYANSDYRKNWYDSDLIDKYAFWLADYSGDADYECLFHQYTSTGKVNGISGNVDMNYWYDRKKSDEMGQYRSEVVKLAQSWLGKNETDGSHKDIIDIYNSFNGVLPRNTKMQYDWSWCACTWSAIAIKLGYTDVMPIEISCGYLIEAAKKMGIWKENDGYIPTPGDAILYDWDDTGKGNNTGWPEHVGIIEYVNEDSGYFVVIEGNYNNSVKKRTVSINGKFIRGFITPKYDKEANYTDGACQTSGKDVKTIAHEVIAGIWGNGEKRKKALESAGYDYEVVRTQVNAILNGSAVTTTTPIQNQTQPVTKIVTATCAAKKFSKNLAGSYKTTADLYLRNDAGKNKRALCLIPKGTEVCCYGYYNVANSVRWLYIQVTIDGVLYTGFSSSAYLKK